MFFFILPSIFEDLTLTLRLHQRAPSDPVLLPPPRYRICSAVQWTRRRCRVRGRKETVLLYIFSTKNLTTKKRQKKTVKMFERGPDASERFLKRTSEEKKKIYKELISEDLKKNVLILL